MVKKDYRSESPLVEQKEFRLDQKWEMRVVQMTDKKLVVPLEVQLWTGRWEYLFETQLAVL
jgi:hypothetical protein